MTLLYGTALPGPDIGRRAADTMRAVRDAGFETGIHCWDHVKWQDGVAGADADWTGEQMRRACERYAEIFKEPPRVHGAAGWQMNVHALRLTQVLGFDYCSDSRGTHPPPAGVERRDRPLPATADHAADARRADRHRRRRPRTTSPAHLLALTHPPGSDGPHRATSSRCTRNSRACVSRRCSNACSPAGRRRATGCRRCGACTRRSSRWRCRAARSAWTRCPAAAVPVLCQRREFLADVDLARAA